MRAAFRFSAGRAAVVVNAGATEPKGTHAVQVRRAFARDRAAPRNYVTQLTGSVVIPT